ncbi:unnamed protein product [Discosporangium mesarthrocarpum]
MTDEQENEKVVWTPSSMIRRLGKEINNEESIYYWCWKASSLWLCFPLAHLLARIQHDITAI